MPSVANFVYFHTAPFHFGYLWYFLTWLNSLVPLCKISWFFHGAPLSQRSCVGKLISLCLCMMLYEKKYLFQLHGGIIRDVHFLNESWPWGKGQKTILSVASDGTCKVCFMSTLLRFITLWITIIMHLIQNFCYSPQTTVSVRGEFRNHLRRGPNLVFRKIDRRSRTFFRLSPILNVTFGLLRGVHGPMAPPKYAPGFNHSLPHFCVGFLSGACLGKSDM